jgi:hemoglobin
MARTVSAYAKRGADDAETAMDQVPEQRAAIERMVRRFYERGLADPVLGPIFRGAIHDWDSHIRLVADFWSSMLHGTQRYQGNVFGVHTPLKFEPEAFEHWIATFTSAANEALTPADAEQAIRIARHMVQSFKVGLFPFTGADGRPSRVPTFKN